MSFIKRALSGATFRHDFTSAVILAAGVGERFECESGTKQNVPVCGIPAVVRAALAFEKSEIINEIILVGRREEIPVLEGYVKDYSLDKVTKVAEGGKTRDESSYNGFLATSKKAKYVAIHDGARCLVTPEMIDDAVRAAFRYGAAACAEKVVDTVKRTNRRGFIEETVSRENLWLIKTPQVFKRSIYLVSAAKARKDKITVTDDCMMAEHSGFSVMLVECGSENIKLTTRDDLLTAERIIEQRSRAEGEK